MFMAIYVILSRGKWRVYLLFSVFVETVIPVIMAFFLSLSSYSYFLSSVLVIVDPRLLCVFSTT